MTEVINENGDRVFVCENCLESHYFYCEHCGEWHHDSHNAIDNMCEDCAGNSGEYYRCEDCGEWMHIDNSYWVGDDYNGYYVCEGCIDNYTYCEHCEEYHSNGEMHTVFDADGNEIEVCENCRDNDFEQCEECGEWWAVDAMENGLCPECRGNDEESENKKSA